jgi:hypothetical protein
MNARLIVAREDVSGGALDETLLVTLRGCPRVHLAEITGKHEAFSSRRVESTFFEVFDAMLTHERR